jgi:hypothetical protein
MNITIHRDGQNYGPYSLEEVKQQLAAGNLVPTDLAFIEGATEWTTLNLVPGALSGAPPPPPPKTSKIPPPPVQPSAHAVAPVTKGKGGFVKSCLGCLGVIVIGLIVLGVIGSLGSKGGNSPSSQPSSTPANASTDQSSAPPIDSSIPVPQKTFTTVIESFETPYNNADTEIKKTSVRFDRKDAISQYFSQSGNLQFQGWTGQVQALTTESDGKAYVSIKLAGSGVVIETWNNSASDLFANSMIPRGDPLYPSLMNLKEGDNVTVSGAFIQDDSKGLDYIVESSLTEDGSMTGPEFIVKFSQINKQ